MVLLFAPRARADITVTNLAEFATAISNTITAGGGTIIVTTPIVIGTTNGDAADETFDGESKVTVSGGNTNAIFTVDSGRLTLANMTVANGVDAKFGGAMYIAADAIVVLTNCTFFNNHVFGTNGDSADSSTNSSGTAVFGKNGGRGTAGDSAYGGAILNVGDLGIFNCKFITNSAIGGTGGDGGDGESAGSRGGNGGSGGAGGSGIGGGVFNYGTLVVSNCTFSGNVAQGGSGGIGGAGGGGIIAGANGFAGAAGIGAGAGIYTADTNTALVLNSTFDHNTARGGDSSAGGTSPLGFGQNGPRGGDALGGGIENSADLFVLNSTFFQNNALGGSGGNGGAGGARAGNGGAGGSAIGGGIYNSSYITVVNSTFSKGNAIGGTNGTAGSGLVAGKDGKRGGSFGGNIANVAKKKHGSFQLFNSIIASALSGGGGYGTISNGGFNISADKSIKFQKGTKSNGSLMNTNPFVGDLGDNGGPTQTIPLKTNSVAIDFVPSDLAPSFDQRGFARPVGSASDAGAFEINLLQVIIIDPPKSTNVIAGSNATFTVTAGGAGPLFYQWYFNSSPIAGATTNILSITNAQTTNAGSYFVIVTNMLATFNAATSSVATLTVTNFTPSPPIITQQPTNRQDVVSGTSVTISVTATSTVPVFYQWYFEDSSLNDFTLVGATNNLITIANAQTTNFGSYWAVITNTVGAVTSSISKLNVTNAPGNPNPGTSLRLKGAQAPKMQMSSAPPVERKPGRIVDAEFEASVEEPMAGRALHSVRAAESLENPMLMSSTRRARSDAPYHARLERHFVLFRLFLREVS
jgi:Ig-like domain-containing protein